ncbi:peptide-methionine (S)-S-oxide reductase MsrA [Aestuariivirga sp.]|uniref:peptide-methionine (S)-S-oxide reductase MsrA n=1 Tax=Aestuariivirga sp. TaxID=2650926 RepID=UPI0035934F8E
MRKLFHAVSLAAVLTAAVSAAPAMADTAIFAGGCFWCVESDMDHVKGVTDTISGYAGGTTPAPTYKSHEGYTEAVKVEFDPAIISYEALTAHFLRTIDVTDGGGQFCDRGDSYIPALFPVSAEQKAAATRALDAAAADLKQPVAVKLGDNPSFFPAEEYHQNYYQGDGRVLTRFGLIRQSEAYKRYREGCGRDARVKDVWGDAAFSYPLGEGKGS